MIDAETYAEIRKLAIQGESQRSISKQLGISRDTVAKYSKGSHIPGVSEQRSATESAGKAEIKEAIRKYVDRHSDNQTPKHKINGKTLWRDLRHKYPRSKSTYRLYWSEIRGELQKQTRLPLIFKIAEAAQVDWKMAKARAPNGEIDVHVLCVNLMYAHTPFKKAYPNEKQCSLLDGLVSAVKFYGGSPLKFILDYTAEMIIGDVYCKSA